MPALLLGPFFVVLGGIFLGLAVRESIRNRSAGPAQKTWVRIGLIFVSVGLALSFLHHR
jgi:hypothetical protein